MAAPGPAHPRALPMRLLLLGAALLTAAPLSAQTRPPRMSPDSAASPFRGVYTVIYRVPELAAGREWYAGAFGLRPYFDEPYYVGFDVGGYELGLLPTEGDQRPGAAGVVAYWGVEDIEAAVARLVEAGATVHSPVEDVGGDIRVATLEDPYGNLIGVIRNPAFRPRSP